MRVKALAMQAQQVTEKALKGASSTSCDYLMCIAIKKRIKITIPIPAAILPLLELKEHKPIILPTRHTIHEPRPINPMMAYPGLATRASPGFSLQLSLLR